MHIPSKIQMESFVRKIPAFSRFLKMAALTNGQVLNFTSLASDTGIPASSIREYYHILEDTFLGFMLPAWTKTTKRKALSTAKFYFFDLGVTNTLADITQLKQQSNLYGHAFEHFIALELRAYLSYRRSQKILSYWRSTHDHEVDFIIGDEIAIEIKATLQVQDKHLKGLHILAEENICKQYFLISKDKIHRKKDNIEMIYWRDFLAKLWQDSIFEP